MIVRVKEIPTKTEKTLFVITSIKRSNKNGIFKSKQNVYFKK